jgi:hypothetical protein
MSPLVGHRPVGGAPRLMEALLIVMFASNVPLSITPIYQVFQEAHGVN